WPPKYSGLGRLLARDDVLAYAQQIAQNIMSNAIESEHRFLVEKSPSHLYSMKLIAEIFPKARFIHVLRDGRDVSVSVRAAARSWMPDWQHTFGGSMEASAKSWRDAVRRARYDGKAVGDRFMEIHYEFLRVEPFDATKKMFDFCEIPYDEAILQSIYEKTDFDLNYKGDETDFRRGGRTGDWQSSFSLLDAYYFDRAAGQLLKNTGYVNDKRWWLTFWRERLGLG
ncbi:MAG: sulfotransferase, partial [Chloroflexi bacterium]|nr:sulfotransferase [Chloroflexota bacterium]